MKTSEYQTLTTLKLRPPQLDKKIAGKIQSLIKRSRYDHLSKQPDENDDDDDNHDDNDEDDEDDHDLEKDNDTIR